MYRKEMKRNSSKYALDCSEAIFNHMVDESEAKQSKKKNTETVDDFSRML